MRVFRQRSHRVFCPNFFRPVNFSSLGLGRGKSKNTHQQFVVLGLGRFGRAVCGTLHDLGYEVLGVDDEQGRVDSATHDNLVSHALRLDVTDPNALQEAGLFEMETAIVAIGNFLGPSVIATMSLKEAGVKWVVAKASSDTHAKLLAKVGADKVVFPEHEMGCELARNLTKPSIIERLDLDPENSVVEVCVPLAFDGKTLQELNLRNRYGVSALAIGPPGSGQSKNGRGDARFVVNPSSDARLQAGMALVIVGKNTDIEKLPL